jgi:hypothetical protein
MVTAAISYDMLNSFITPVSHLVLRQLLVFCHATRGSAIPDITVLGAYAVRVGDHSEASVLRVRSASWLHVMNMIIDFAICISSKRGLLF